MKPRQSVVLGLIGVLLVGGAISYGVYADQLDASRARERAASIKEERLARQKAIQAELSAGSEKMMKDREAARAAAEDAERIAEAERIEAEAEAEASAQAERDAQAARPSGYAPAPASPTPNAPAPAPVQQFKKVYKCACGLVFDHPNDAEAHQLSVPFGDGPNHRFWSESVPVGGN